MNLPDNIMCMSLMELKRSKDSKGVLLAFDTGVVQLYNEKILVTGFATDLFMTFSQSDALNRFLKFQPDGPSPVCVLVPMDGKMPV